MKQDRLICWDCKKEYPAGLPRWECDCGGLLNVKQKPGGFSREKIEMGPFSLWRYREALIPISPSSVVSLGEGCTPLVASPFRGFEIFFKLEFVSPTGSFKDRGAALLISKIKELGIDRVVEDSSGNAAASISAYCAKAGIHCDIYSPEGTSPGKLRQTQSYGATLHVVQGSREDTAHAAEEAAKQHYYASHQKNPFFNEGLKTFAFEIWEQMKWEIPDAVVVAIGGGGLLLGSYLGFKQLLLSGEISRLPKIFGVQAEACAPVYQAFVEGREKTSRVEKKPTIAEGISIVNPVRGAEILAAVRETGGAVEAVGEEEIRSSVKELALKGIYVEPTSGAVPAALDRLFSKGLLSRKDRVVVALTGSGLKTASLM
jgi:threonine synthase